MIAGKLKVSFGPAEDHAKDAGEFRAFLAELGKGQTDFARWLIENGDDRSEKAALRHVQRMALGEARISGEMRVIMSLVRRRGPAYDPPPLSPGQ